MRSRRAEFVVLDGLVMAHTAAASDEDLKLFVAEIQAHSTLAGCTTLLLTSEHADRPVSAEQTMVDGILLLRERAYGPRRERNIEVVKFRGSSTLRGNHAFRIGPDGIVIYPRLEAGQRESVGDAVRPPGLATGVRGLDAMFDIGGYPRSGITAVSGPSGSGKTTLALHHVAQGGPQAPALFVGFYESPELLARMAEVTGVAPAKRLLAEVNFLPLRFGENMLDELAARVLAEVRRLGAVRVAIDSIGGFMSAPAYPERGGAFVAALTQELRLLGASTLITVEESDTTGARVTDTPTLSSLTDTLLQLTVRREGSVQRHLAIRKSRISRCDLRVRELVLTDTGLAVADGEQALAA
jgi:circadian clock protein KaiC